MKKIYELNSFIKYHNTNTDLSNRLPDQKELLSLNMIISNKRGDLYYIKLSEKKGNLKIYINIY